MQFSTSPPRKARIVDAQPGQRRKLLEKQAIAPVETNGRPAASKNHATTLHFMKPRPAFCPSGKSGERRCDVAAGRSGALKREAWRREEVSRRTKFPLPPMVAPRAAAAKREKYDGEFFPDPLARAEKECAFIVSKRAAVRGQKPCTGDSVSKAQLLVSLHFWIPGARARVSERASEPARYTHRAAATRDLGSIRFYFFSS